jgi:hypothetical protein
MWKIGSFGLVLVCVYLVSGCATGSGETRVSSSLKNGEITLSSFKYVTIYEGKYATEIELRLESLFEERGFIVVGEKDITDAARTLGIRYSRTPIFNGYGDVLGGVTRILIEAVDTDKTLATINWKQTRQSEDDIWNNLSKGLGAVLSRTTK